MPVYESDTITLEELKKLRKQNVCAICGGWLNLFFDTQSSLVFLACNDWLRTHHEGIARLSEYRELNIPTWREKMEKQIGAEKTNKLVKYQGITSLTRPQAMEIMETIWPGAPALDKVAVAILCSDYGLNPLANHVFLIPFKEKWVRVWGIKAKRLLASRKGDYSYLDMTPRLMTEEEQVKVWGAVDQNNLCFMTHLKDMKSAAEAYGYGKWPLEEKPYGTDKGNSQANMASIRSESQALDRLRPAEMPTGFAIADEQYIEAKVIDTTTGEIIEGEVKEIKAEAEPTPVTPESKTEGIKTEASSSPPSKPKRDEAAIKTFTDLCKACKADFNLTPQQVLAERNISSWTESTETSAAAYRAIAKVRTS